MLALKKINKWNLIFILKIIFITKSTAPSKEKIKVDGVEYPLIKLEVSRTSHPYYTGKTNLVDTAGRIDKFKTKYSKFKK